ncbi:MAG: nucleotidyltransferase [Alphaproteobacteria bacterium]|nr:nucleotidyltransferase [Alphaproteobacteria bacterium]
MDLPTDFKTFLQEIRPTSNMRKDLQTGHKTLRRRLRADADLAPIIVSDFLQGSYRRHTAVRPTGGKRSDVDIIVVTKLDEAEYGPVEAMDLFEPFLKKHYDRKWRRQGRSFGIELSYVDLDLVITSAPSESEVGILTAEAVTNGEILDEDSPEVGMWRLNAHWLSEVSRFGRIDADEIIKKAAAEPEWKPMPLRIPDREAGVWEDTHPLQQIIWTRDKNAATNGHFVNVVKCIKWWRLVNHDEPKHPKGFPLERLVGEHCPDGLSSVAEGVTLTLEGIQTAYSAYVALGLKPSLPDYGVPAHDVFGRINAEDFAAFYEQIKEGAALARRALDEEDRTKSGNLWRDLFGTKFPLPPDNGGSAKKGGFTEPTEAAVPGTGRFA